MWLTSLQLFLTLGLSAAAKALKDSDLAKAADRGMTTGSACVCLADLHENDTVYTWNPDESDTISHLNLKTRQQDAIFSEAVQLLDSLKTSPSCNRIAATKLVTSCQDFESTGNVASDTHTQESLDHIRSVYAARLAICELDGAGASVPSPCFPVTVPSPTVKTRLGFLPKFKAPDIGSDVVPPELLGQCLKALESRPQWWTSYSNNRQNAMVICQASRMEVEQEQLLELHRSVLQSNVKLDEGLREAVRKAAMEASQHHAFVQNIRDLQDRLVMDVETSQSLFQRAFGKLLHEIEVGIRTVEAVVNSASSQVQNRTTILQQVSIKSVSRL